MKRFDCLQRLLKNVIKQLQLGICLRYINNYKKSIDSYTHLKFDKSQPPSVTLVATVDGQLKADLIPRRPHTNPRSGPNLHSTALESRPSPTGSGSKNLSHRGRGEAARVLCQVRLSTLLPCRTAAAAAATLVYQKFHERRCWAGEVVYTCAQFCENRHAPAPWFSQEFQIRVNNSVCNNASQLAGHPRILMPGPNCEVWFVYKYLRLTLFAAGDARRKV